MKTKTVSVTVAALLWAAFSVQADPKVRLIRGTWIEETFHRKGIISITWKLDRDWMTDQTRWGQTKWHNVYFDKVNGNPIRIINKGVFERDHLEGAFRPVSGEEIFVYLLDATGKIKEATTNQIPRTTMGGSYSLNGSVGRFVETGTYQKRSVLQKSTFEIDNSLDDRGWTIYFKYSSPTGGGTNAFPTVTTSVGPFKKIEFIPTVTDGSLSIKKSIEWMQFYKVEGELTK